MIEQDIINQLAKEHGLRKYSGIFPDEYIVRLHELEAFAKAYHEAIERQRSNVDAVAYLRRTKMTDYAISLLPMQLQRDDEKQKGWSQWEPVEIKDFESYQASIGKSDWMHTCEFIPLFAAPQQSPIPQGWKPTDDEILEFAGNEELFLFANQEDLMAIANGVIELIQLRINKLSAAPSAPIEAQQSYADGLEAAAQVAEKVCFGRQTKDDMGSSRWLEAGKCGRQTAQAIRALIPSTQAPEK